MAALTSGWMGRRVDVDKLCGTEEVAQRLGLRRYQHVHTLRERDSNFPEPVLKLTKTMIWYWPDVERWAKSVGRRIVTAHASDHTEDQ